MKRISRANARNDRIVGAVALLIFMLFSLIGCSATQQPAAPQSGTTGTTDIAGTDAPPVINAASTTNAITNTDATIVAQATANVQPTALPDLLQGDSSPAILRLETLAALGATNFVNVGEDDVWLDSNGRENRAKQEFNILFTVGNHRISCDMLPANKKVFTLSVRKEHPAAGDRACIVQLSADAEPKTLVQIGDAGEAYAVPTELISALETAVYHLTLGDGCQSECLISPCPCAVHESAHEAAES